MYLQDWAKEWTLDCVNPASGLPLSAGGEFTQPIDHSIPALYVACGVLHRPRPLLIANISSSLAKGIIIAAARG